MTQPRGQVYDIGYQRYTGVREGQTRARLAIYKDGLRAAMGIGRGGRAKVLPWMFIGAMVITGLVMALLAGAADRLGGEGTSEQLNLPSHAQFYGIASIIMFLFGATAAPELLCPDRQNGVINLYLVRPLTGTDYLGARWLAFLTVMVAVAWLPQFVLFAGLALGAADSGEYLRENWLDVPRFLAAGVVMSVYVTTLAFLISSFTTRRAYAAAFLVGLFVITSALSGSLQETLTGGAGQAVSLLGLSSVPLHVNDIIFDRESGLTQTSGTPGGPLPAYVRVLWWAFLTAGPGLLLWRRYQGMRQ